MQYIGTDLHTLYRDWDRRTNLTLSCRGRDWTVQALNQRTRFLFGIGWFQFVADNSIALNDELLFLWLGDYTFQVVILG